MEEGRIACKAVRISVPVEVPTSGASNRGALVIAEHPDPHFCTLSVTGPADGGAAATATVTVLLDHRTWEALTNQVFHTRYGSAIIDKPEEGEPTTFIEQIGKALDSGLIEPSEIVAEVARLRESLNYQYQQVNRKVDELKIAQGQVAQSSITIEMRNREIEQLKAELAGAVRVPESGETINTAPRRTYNLEETESWTTAESAGRTSPEPSTGSASANLPEDPPF